MISIIFQRKDKKIVSFNISGHAESVDEGYDLVCCAVSAISITIANGITEILNIDAPTKVEDGFLSLCLEDVPKAKVEECQVLLETMLLGLKNVEYSYGDYINIIVEEV